MKVVRTPALLLLAVLPACHEVPSPSLRSEAPALALELAFEDTCRPVVPSELGLSVSPSGISFRPGVEGRALRLEEAAVRLAGLERLQLPDSLTLEFFVNLDDWHNPYGEGTVKNLVAHGDVLAVAVKGWGLEARVTTEGAARPQRLTGDSFAPGSWHHVALVLDGAAGSARLVLDGRDVARTSVRGSLAIDPALELVIGSWREQEEGFTGLLDSVRIWARALSEDELRARAAMLAPGSAGV